MPRGRQHHDHRLPVSGRLRAHYLGVTDARPVALFRIALGLVVALDGVDRIIDIRGLYSDAGILPRALLREAFGFTVDNPLAYLIGSPTTGVLLTLVGIAAALLFALGFHGRFSAAVMWIYLTAFMSRNVYASDGADDVMIVMASWSLFIDVDAAWSVRRRAQRWIPAWPVRAAETQIALIYLVAGLSKSGPLWRHGQALFAILQINNFVRPVGMTLLAWPTLCAVLTFGTLVVERAFLPLALWPLGWGGRYTRPVAALTAAGLHVAIFALMRVGLFSYVMVACLCLFVPGCLFGPTSPPAPAPPSRARAVAHVLLAAQLGLCVVAAIATLSSWSLPGPLRTELRRLYLSQQWKMFSPDPPDFDGYWAATGTLADGRTIDVLAQAAPALAPHNAFRFRRWYKLSDTTVESPPLQALLLRYVCRRLDTLPRLVDVHLQLWQRPTFAPRHTPHRYAMAFDRPMRCR